MVQDNYTGPYADIARRLGAFDPPRVPSVGTTTVSLAAAMARVKSAEQALELAREQARAAARREGRGIGGLFSRTLFVTRAGANGWVDEARKEERKAATRRVSDAHAEGRAAVFADLERIYDPTIPGPFPPRRRC